jgi:Big-like domain-containing protein
MRIPPVPQVCFGLLCVLLILITGCSNPSSQTLASLTVTATPSTLSVGGSAVLKAVAHLSDGTTQDVTSGTQWTLSNPALATMTSSAVTAKAPGTVTVQAAYVEATPAGTSPSATSASPENLSASTQITISTTPSTNTPAISWSAPAAVFYGTALSSTQLNATANVPGTFTYTPAAGTVLKAGTQTLSVVFTPTDSNTYSSATATVQLTVNQASPVITWAPLAAIATGTALSATQLDATANVPGTFSYNPAAGYVPPAGTLQLAATFTPTDGTDYAVSPVHNTLVVGSTGSPTPTPPTNPPLTGCGGPTINVNSGMSPSTLSSTIASAPSCAVIVFAAGTYGPITSTITIPCGVSLTGPTVPYSQTPNQTAIINGSPSFTSWAFQTTPGCSASQTIEYLQWNGEHANTSTTGGGFIDIVAGTSNLTITNNYLHGADTIGADNGSVGPQSSQIWFNGSGSTAISNVNITWNQLGGTSFGDCSGAFSDSGGTEISGGSYCHGIGINSVVSKINITNNNLTYLEEQMKVYSSNSSSCTNININQNHFNQGYRIALETQCYTGNSVSMNVQYNDTVSKYSTNLQQDNWSIANGCSNAITATCITHNDYNVILETTSCCNSGNEIWGGSATNPAATNYATSTTTNYNLYQGYLYDGITWSAAGNLILNNNTFNIVNNGTDTNCLDHSGGFWNWNTNGGSDVPLYTPTCTGNTFSNNITGTYASAAPTISPASGTLSGSQVVTIANTGANRDLNTTDWCTTDGSTPTPGSGTAVGYYNGGSLTVSSTTTVKCVGMWGSLNQPYSYPSGYGYVPSAVVTASFTAAGSPAVKQPSGNARSAVSGTDTVAATEAAGRAAAAGAELASIAVVPAQATVAIGSNTQLKAIATFSDGSTKDVTTDFAWASSDTRTITASSSGLLSGLASGKATITGSYQGRQASVPAVSSIGEVNWSGPIVITEAGTYSGNWQSTDSKTPAVTVATTAPVVIENAHIRSVAGLIKTGVAGADLTVRNSVALALNPAVKGQANGVFLDASSPARLDVENNYVENAGGGVLVHGYSGNRDGQQTIVIRANRARNLNGLLSDGNGGYQPGVGSNSSVSSFIELDKVQAVPGVDLGWNEVINYPGRSLVADNIAIKSSSGTPNQPLEIHDTYIQGAYPYTAAQADYQGGGIRTVGSPDDSAQQAPAFNNIHDNQVVGTVNYGIEFTAGHDNIAANNRVISSGLLADGTRIAAQHVGMANGVVNGASSSMYNNTMHDNLIGWACWNSSCSQSGYRKDQSFPASPGDYSTNSVLAPKPISPETENNEYQIWLNKTASAGIVVGPSL